MTPTVLGKRIFKSVGERGRRAMCHVVSGRFNGTFGPILQALGLFRRSSVQKETTCQIVKRLQHAAQSSRQSRTNVFKGTVQSKMEIHQQADGEFAHFQIHLGLCWYQATRTTFCGGGNAPRLLVVFLGELSLKLMVCVGGGGGVDTARQTTTHGQFRVIDDPARTRRRALRQPTHQNFKLIK